MKRLALVFMFLALNAGTASALNWLPRTRRLHESFDLVVKHLEKAIDHVKKDSQTWRDIKASLHHMEPIRTQFGGEIKWGAIDLGTPDEEKLIAAQYGYAKKAVSMGELREDIYEGFWRWCRRRFWGVARSSVVYGPVLLWLFWNRRKIKKLFVKADTMRRLNEEEQIALRKLVRAAHPDKDERLKLFAGDLTNSRGHQRLKGEGKL